jgi:type IV pilus assembly protein PilA
LKKVFGSHKSQGGFTLIELLIVIAVLGILAAIVVPNMVGYVGKAHISAANTEFNEVQTAATSWMATSNTITAQTGITGSGTSQGVLQDFLSGVLKGTYDISANGVVTPTSSGYTDVTTWTTATQLWSR